MGLSAVTESVSQQLLTVSDDYKQLELIVLCTETVKVNC